MLNGQRPLEDHNWMSKDPLTGFLTGSVLMHLLFVGSLFGYAFFMAHRNQDRWGTVSSGTAIEASLVSSAPALPLPNPETPNNNVLATDTPSPAPITPEEKTAAAPTPDAIPIAVKQPKEKVAPKKQEKAPPQPVQKQQHVAAYGQAAPSSIPMNAQSAHTNGVTVQNGDFGSRFGWYVDAIKRKVAQNWYSQLADPRASMGRSAVVTFTVHRDGSVSNVHVEQSSGVSSLDTSGVQAVLRTDSVGPLPDGYAGSSVSVAYTFTYDEATKH